MVRLTDLEALVAVASAGSITGAAQRLGRSQPTVSRQIARLEEQLGTRLLARDMQGVAMTPGGELALEFATEVLKRYTALTMELEAADQHLSGTIRIITSTAPATLLQSILGEFSRRQQDVRFNVSFGDSAAVATAVVAGNADIGLSGFVEHDPRLERIEVGSDEIVLAVPSTHRFAARRRVSLAELAGERFVLRERGSGTQRLFFDAAAEAGHHLEDADATVMVANAHAVLEAVAAGLGVGIVSELSRAHHTADVVGVRLRELSLVRPLWLVRRAGASDDAQAALVAHLVRVFPRHAAL